MYKTGGKNFSPRCMSLGTGAFVDDVPPVEKRGSCGNVGWGGGKGNPVNSGRKLNDFGENGPMRKKTQSASAGKKRLNLLHGEEAM